MAKGRIEKGEREGEREKDEKGQLYFCCVTAT